MLLLRLPRGVEALRAGSCSEQATWAGQGSEGPQSRILRLIPRISSRQRGYLPREHSLTIFPTLGHTFRHKTAAAFGPDLAKKLSQLVKMEKNVMRSMELVSRERMEVAVSGAGL